MLLWGASAGLAQAETLAIPLEAGKVKVTNVKAEPVTWKGRAALRVTDDAPASLPDGARYAIVPGGEFQDGAIELDLTGDTLPGASPAARGFTGLAFRMMPDGKYEAFYLRPKNGRAEDQEQRNHSTQYMATPDFPWQKLRQETPSKYESYVDLVPGEWNHIKIEVRGDKARLYVNGAQQPALIVNDLKHGASKGAIALWVGPGTVAHFANLKVTR
jgi:hypothetical protein